MKTLISTDITGIFIFTVLLFLSQSQVNGVPLDFLNDLFGGGDTTDDSGGASADLSASSGAAGSASLSVDKDIPFLGHKGLDASVAGAVSKDFSIEKGKHEAPIIINFQPTPPPPPPVYTPPPYGYEPKPYQPHGYQRPPQSYPHPGPGPVRIEDEPIGIPFSSDRRPQQYHPNPPPNYRNAPRPVGHGY